MQFIFKMKTEEDDEAFEILSFEKFKDTNKNEKKKQHVLEFKRACMCMCVCVFTDYNGMFEAFYCSLKTKQKKNKNELNKFRLYTKKTNISPRRKKFVYLIIISLH